MFAPITFGGDPELPIFRNGKLCYPPNKLLDLDIDRDGIAVEIHPAATTCRGILLASFGNALSRLQEGGEEYRFVPTVDITEEFRAGVPEDAFISGCRPSMNAYSRKKEGMIQPPEETFRAFSGHLHFGNLECSPPKEKDKIFEWIKLLDLHLGLPLSILFHSDRQYQRRAYYGRAGDFRLKQFKKGSWAVGTWTLEYRTPDLMAWSHPFVLSWALRVSREVLRKPPVKVPKALSQEVEDAINYDASGAASLLRPQASMFDPKSFMDNLEMIRDLIVTGKGGWIAGSENYSSGYGRNLALVRAFEGA